jgi:mono/diheme cytochrome c family protein
MHSLLPTIGNRGITMKNTALRAGVLLLFWIARLTAQQSQTTIRTVPVQGASPASGVEMFNRYCAVCHGKDAKGNGPAVPALRVPPPDLTTLAQRHGGKFPADYVGAVLRNGVGDTRSHGSKDMPIWGPLFSSLGGGRSAPAALRISKLSRYIDSLQTK